MKRIYKYTLRDTIKQTVSLPTGYKILSVGNQRGNAVLWAEVDPTAPLEDIRIVVSGTGDIVPSGQYLGTLQFDGLVLHYYKED